MPTWNSDTNANKFKNMYVQDVNSTGFAMDICGNVIMRNSSFGLNVENPSQTLEISGNALMENITIHNENGIHFDNTTKGSYIGENVNSDLLNGSTNFSIGSQESYQRIKQWTHYDTSMNNSDVLSIDSCNNTMVAVGTNNFAYSNDDGMTWNNIDVDASGVYPSTYKYGVNKIRIFRNNGSQAKALKINEIQYWEASANIMQTTDVSLSYNNAELNSLTRLKNSQLVSRNVENVNFISTIDDNNDLIITLSGVHTFDQIQSVVLYNNIEDLTGLQDASFQLIDYDERVVFEALLSGAKEIYRLDGSDFANYSKVGGNSSTNFIIDNGSYSFNRLRLERTNYDGNPISLRELQLWKKKTPTYTTFNRVTLTSESLFNIFEIEIWIEDDSGNSINICDNTIIDGNSNQDVYNISVNNNYNNLIDGNKFSNGHSGSTFQIDFDNIQYDKIQTIIVYKYEIDYDNNVVFSIKNDNNSLYDADFGFDNSFDIVRFDGPAMNNSLTTTTDPNTVSNTIVGLENVTYVFTALNVKKIIIDSLYIENIIPDGVLQGNIDLSHNLTSSNILFNSANLYDDIFDNSFTSILQDTGIFLDFSFNTVLNSDDVISIAFFTEGTNIMNGISLQLFNDNVQYFDYEIFSNSHIYRFDNPNNLDISGAFIDDISFSTIGIFDSSNVLKNSFIADVNEIDISVATKSKWKPLNHVVYRNSQFVALGDRTILLSSNGSDWNGYTFDIINSGNGEVFLSSDYDTANNRFLALVESGENIVWTTPGVFTNNLNTIGSSFNAVIYAEDIFVAAGNEKMSYFDGSSWNDFDVSYNMISLAYDPILGFFVAISNSGDILSSSNGQSWTLVKSYTDYVFKSIKYIEKYFVIGGENFILYSSNGVIWTQIKTKHTLNDVTYGTNNYVGVSSKQNVLINDGIIQHTHNIGYNNVIGHSNSIVIGNNSESTQSNQILLNKDVYITQKLGINTDEPVVSLHIDSSDAIIIPIGNSESRPTGMNGMMRFNSGTSKYEGYANGWFNLNDVSDFDKDTFITLENSAFEDNDEIRFYTNNIERMKLDSDGRLILPNNTVIGENSKLNFGDTSYNVVLGNNIQCNRYRKWNSVLDISSNFNNGDYSENANRTIVVSQDSSASILRSIDNGQTWTVDLSENSYNDVVYGNNKFLAVGNDEISILHDASDAWLTNISYESSGNIDWSSVDYGALNENNGYVVVAHQETPQFSISGESFSKFGSIFEENKTFNKIQLLNKSHYTNELVLWMNGTNVTNNGVIRPQILTTFNKVRIMRTSNAPFNTLSQDRMNRFECLELQVWVNVNGVLENVALDGTTFTSNVIIRDAHPITNINDGDSTSTSVSDHMISTYQSIDSETDPGAAPVVDPENGSAFGIEFDTSYDIMDFAAIIHYKLNSQVYNNYIGQSFQLLNGNTVVYTRELTTQDLGELNTDIVEVRGPGVPVDYDFNTGSTNGAIIDERVEIATLENTLSLTFNYDLKFDEIETIIYFGNNNVNASNNDYDSRNIGSVLQILDGNSVLYNYEIKSSANIYRFDGASIFNVSNNVDYMSYAITDKIYDYNASYPMSPLGSTYMQNWNSVVSGKYNGPTHTQFNKVQLLNMVEDISSQLVIYDGSSTVVPYSVQDDILFNKVRLLRTNSSNYIQMNISEIQIWVAGVNIAPNYSPVASSSDASNIIDGDLTTLWESDTSDNNPFVYIPIVDTSINSLQSIVVYDTSGNAEKMIGVSVQVMYNDTVIFSKEITTIRERYRLDGYEIANYTIFSMSNSASEIFAMNKDSGYLGCVNGYNLTLSSPLLFNDLAGLIYNSGFFFNRVRLIRTTDSQAVISNGSPYENRIMSISELQIWVDGSNIAMGKTPFATSNDGSSLLESNVNDASFVTNWSSSTLNDNDPYIYIPIDETHINQLQSIVMYGYWDANNLFLPGSMIKNSGISFQLMYNEHVLYSVESQDVRDIYRLDGPNISNVGQFATDKSSDYIYNVTENLSILDTINENADFYHTKEVEIKLYNDDELTYHHVNKNDVRINLIKGPQYSSQNILDASGDWPSIVIDASSLIGNNIWVAVGDNGASMMYNDVWKYNVHQTNSDFKSVAFGNNVFVAVGTNMVAYSKDGDVWSDVISSLTVNGSWSHVSFSENIFYVSSGGSIVLYSEDGKSWSSFDFGYNVNAVISSDFHLLGLGNEKILFNDGVINNVIAIGNGANVEYENAVAIGNNAVAERENHFVLGSSDHIVSIPGKLGLGVSNAEVKLAIGNGLTGFDYYDENSLSINTNGLNRLSINSNGFVGIGTSNPQEILHVETSNYWSGIFKSTFDETNSCAIGVGKDTSANNIGELKYTHIEDGSSNNMLSLGFADNGDKLVVKADGNVGIGTTSPEADLHIKRTGDATFLLEADSNNVNETDNAVIELRQDGGLLRSYFGHASGSNELTIGNSSSHIVFATKDVDSSTIDDLDVRMIVTATGNVGIGTESPNGTMHIYESTGTNKSATTGSLVLEHGDSGGISSIVFPSAVNRLSDYGYITYQDAASVGGTGETARLTIGTSNDATDNIVLAPTGIVTSTKEITAPSFNATSDIRLKKDIEPLNLCLEQICQLQGVKFTRTDDKKENRQIGFIAQEVEQIIPELVRTDLSGEKYKSIAYGNVTALLVEAVKELRQEVSDLRSQIETLKK